MSVLASRRARPYLEQDFRDLTEEELQFLQDDESWDQTEGGYAHLQRTTPQTLAYALNDSPVGLAAWIVEKFRLWSDCDGDEEPQLLADDICAFFRSLR